MPRTKGLSASASPTQSAQQLPDTDCGININAGFEIGVASTKAYTSQIVAITMMALALSEDSRAKAGMRDDIIASLEALPGVIR